MNENVENLMLEQLRLIRSEISDLRGEMRGEIGQLNEKIDDLQTGQQALQGMIFSLAGYVRGIDMRVEHIEHKLGIET